MILNTWDYLDTESITMPDNPRLEAGARVLAEAVRLAMTVTDARVVEWLEAAGELCLMLAGVPRGPGLEGVSGDTRKVTNSNRDPTPTSGTMAPTKPNRATPRRDSLPGVCPKGSPITTATSAVSSGAYSNSFARRMNSTEPTGS